MTHVGGNLWVLARERQFVFICGAGGSGDVWWGVKGQTDLLLEDESGAEGHGLKEQQNTQELERER